MKIVDLYLLNTKNLSFNLNHYLNIFQKDQFSTYKLKINHTYKIIVKYKKDREIKQIIYIDTLNYSIRKCLQMLLLKELCNVQNRMMVQLFSIIYKIG